MEFEITEEEVQKTVKSFVASTEPLKLKSMPSKEKQKYIILKMIAEKFEKGKTYKELEVNLVLKPIYSDFVTIRRDLIDNHFLTRSADGKEYTVNEIK